MPIATPEQYAEMLDKAKREGFAYPAINVSSSQTVNATLQGLAEALADLEDLAEAVWAADVVGDEVAGPHGYLVRNSGYSAISPSRCRPSSRSWSSSTRR